MIYALALAALVEGAAYEWSALKDVVKAASGGHDDLLHVLAGVLLQVTAALALRRPLSSVLPWLAVAALELANEASDLLVEPWPDRDLQFAEGCRDVVLTLLLPTLVVIVAFALRRRGPG